MNLMKQTLNWDEPDQDPLMPIIIVKDSGRLSSCLSKACDYGENDWNTENEKNLNDFIAKEFVNHKSSAFVGAVDEYTKEERKSIFNFVKTCATDPHKKQWVRD